MYQLASHEKHHADRDRDREWPSNVKYMLIPDWTRVTHATRKLAARERLSHLVKVRSCSTVASSESSSRRSCTSVGVFAKRALQYGDVVGELTGIVFEQASEQPALPCFSTVELTQPTPAVDDATTAAASSRRLILDLSQQGNELAFIRRLSNCKDELPATPNVQWERVYLRKLPSIVCVVVRPIDRGEELVADWSSILPSTALTNSTSNDNRSTTLVDFEHRRYCSTNDWTRVDKRRRRSVYQREHLDGLAVRPITREGHPLQGEFGLFAARDYTRGAVLGEYCGTIVEPDYTGSYVARLLPEEPSPGVDGETEGSELRCLNDYRNIAEAPNVALQKTYIGRYPAVVAIAVSDIARGAELLTDYGDKYWSPLGIEGRSMATPGVRSTARREERDAVREQRQAKRQLRQRSRQAPEIDATKPTSPRRDRGGIEDVDGIGSLMPLSDSDDDGEAAAAATDQ